MKEYQVTLSCERTIIIKALNEEDAMERAETIVNKKNNKWVADSAIQIDWKGNE